MVLIDTSVWISLYRKKGSVLGERLWTLVAANEAALCGQVWVEFLGGFRDDSIRKDYEKSLKAFPFLETSREAHELAAHLLGRHPRLGPGDAIIAATAMSHASPLWTLDKDFHLLTERGLRIF